MATWNEVSNDERFVQVHDHGFVGLLDTFGNDSDIADAARTSYGKGTKTVNNDNNLIRYLVRHEHTSPLEMGEVKFFLKCPIFVMRQLVRHRTASLNEYSARYSVLSNEFYIPGLDYMAPQSKTNKQGRDGGIGLRDATVLRGLMAEASLNAYELYQVLLGPDEFPDEKDAIWQESREYGLSPEFPGLARELARSILPVNNYTELYWKIDLHNFFHMIRLRIDAHAQREIRDFATAMYNLVKPRFPFCAQAFEDYILNAVKLSAMDQVALADMLNGTFVPSAEHYGMSKREYAEFAARFPVQDRHLLPKAA